MNPGESMWIHSVQNPQAMILHQSSTDQPITLQYLTRITPGESPWIPQMPGFSEFLWPCESSMQLQSSDRWLPRAGQAPLPAEPQRIRAGAKGTAGPWPGTINGVPNSWMAYLMENPNPKWMVWGDPYFRKASYRCTMNTIWFCFCFLLSII